MDFSEEQKRIDVTTEERRLRGGPPAPRRARARRPQVPRPDFGAGAARLRASAAGLAGDALSAALPWLRRPAVLAALAAVAAACAFAWTRPPSVDGPALPRAGWRASASPPGDAAEALDGDRSTSWVARDVQVAWFTVDLGRARAFHQAVLDAGADAGSYPRDYAVYVSGDGRHWGGAVASGEGTGPVTVADFPAQSARYVKVIRVARGADPAWSLSEFTLH